MYLYIYIDRECESGILFQKLCIQTFFYVTAKLNKINID